MRVSPWSIVRLGARLTAIVSLAACASSSGPPGASAPTSASGGGSGAPTDEPMTKVVHVDVPGGMPAPEPKLVGARCPAGEPSCRCRTIGDGSGGANDAEKEPPSEGWKRLEIRMSVHGGDGVLQSPTVGKFAAAGVKDTCFYVDVPSGSKSSFQFQSKATDPNQGHTPRFSVFEYGPKGPYWYEVLSFECVGVGGKCDSAGTAAWSARLKERKRGRMDPCGSLVITGLAWDTSGGLAHRDNGYYRDFSVRFDAEVKKFPTQFAPHSTECIPK